MAANHLGPFALTTLLMPHITGRVACTAPKMTQAASDLRVHETVHAARWYSSITPSTTFRRCAGASSGTETGSS